MAARITQPSVFGAVEVLLAESSSAFSPSSRTRTATLKAAAWSAFHATLGALVPVSRFTFPPAPPAADGPRCFLDSVAAPVCIPLGRLRISRFVAATQPTNSGSPTLSDPSSPPPANTIAPPDSVHQAAMLDLENALDRLPPATTARPATEVVPPLNISHLSGRYFHSCRAP